MSASRLRVLMIGAAWADLRRLISSTCVQNEALGTTDFIDKGGSVRVLRAQ